MDNHFKNTFVQVRSSAATGQSILQEENEDSYHALAFDPLSTQLTSGIEHTADLYLSTFSSGTSSDLGPTSTQRISWCFPHETTMPSLYSSLPQSSIFEESYHGHDMPDPTDIEHPQGTFLDFDLSTPRPSSRSTTQIDDLEHDRFASSNVMPNAMNEPVVTESPSVKIGVIISTDDAKKQRKFECTTNNCGKTFLHLREFNRHYNSTHAVPRATFWCTVEGCDRSEGPDNRSFPRKDKMTEHMNKIHKISTA